MTWTLEIENIAGIRSGEADIKPGVNAVRASNWQGKSSFIRAIKTAMGTDRPLTEGESRGRVQLQTTEGPVDVQLRRQGRSVSLEGTPYLTDAYAQRCAELYAFLDEDNAVRRAVRNDENLEAVLTEPLDLENIDEKIGNLKHEREQVESELERATKAGNRVPSLEGQIEDLESELDALREERDAITEGDSGNDDVGSLRQELSESRSEKAKVDDLIDRTENAIERTREKLSERYEQLESIESGEETDVETEIAEARDGLSELERDKELLESLYSVNSRILNEDRVELVSDVDHGLMGDEHACWVCGQETNTEAIETRLEAIRDEIDSLASTVAERRDRVETLQEKRDEQKRMRRRERDLQQEIQRLEDTLNDREDSLESARERHDILIERVEELESRVDESDDRLTSLESEIKYKESELADRREELETCRTEVDRRDALEAERDELTAEIESLRNRKDRIRAETREAFDESIAEVASMFDTSFESAHLTGNFDLVVARDGREVSLDALSEGELELVGLVAALAGYEAYDVDELVPVMLLDGLGGLADENLRTLVDYLEERTTFLVLTAYPENTSFGDWEIDPQEWSVVSNPVTAA
ncbi:archaea-specific SMC-related protein [Natronosalvus caseinilyticus]|uniref:archaea-specific SMC-related protein n=1 Tax=Natronosalvus caseinilyticus TaxID=2953747 RepID=UPI0028A96C9F|nr:archaea-specific SMC-related protein [Natronosalvus caseinilyticus]